MKNECEAIALASFICREITDRYRNPFTKADVQIFHGWCYIDDNMDAERYAELIPDIREHIAERCDDIFTDFTISLGIAPDVQFFHDEEETDGPRTKKLFYRVKATGWKSNSL